MAAENKTEQPTPQRQKKAREQGQIARSRDLTSALALIAAIVSLGWTARQLPHAWRGLLESVLHNAGRGELQGSSLLSSATSVLVATAAPVLAAAWLAAAFTGVSQGGLVFAPALLQPQFSRMNPATRVQQLFSLPALARVLRSILPAFAIVYVAYTMLHRDWAAMLNASRLHGGGIGVVILSRAFELTWKAALVFGVWAVIDYVLERRHLMGELRMSRQELLDEYKESEGNPLIKGRIRRLRRQTLRRRMLEDTKRATVVITNPNEFAIALEYRPAMAAPVILAKGRNLLALQIKQVARWHGIPTIENPPLAHALYRSAEVGQYIPAKLYSAVAAIIAAIYRAERRGNASGGQR